MRPVPLLEIVPLLDVRLDSSKALPLVDRFPIELRTPVPDSTSLLAALFACPETAALGLASAVVTVLRLLVTGRSPLPADCV